MSNKVSARKILDNWTRKFNHLPLTSSKTLKNQWINDLSNVVISYFYEYILSFDPNSKNVTNHYKLTKSIDKYKNEIYLTAKYCTNDDNYFGVKLMYPLPNNQITKIIFEFKEIQRIYLYGLVSNLWTDFDKTMTDPGDNARTNNIGYIVYDNFGFWNGENGLHSANWNKYLLRDENRSKNKVFKCMISADFKNPQKKIVYFYQNEKNEMVCINKNNPVILSNDSVYKEWYPCFGPILGECKLLKAIVE